jgi:hypothetical protein
MICRNLLAVLVAGLLAAGLSAAAAEEKGEAKKGETVEGTIMKVDPSAHRLTVLLKERKAKPEPPQREFTLGAATRFVFLTGAKKTEVTRQEAYKHEQLKEGARVAVVTDGVGRATEVRVGTPTKEPEKK